MFEVKVTVDLSERTWNLLAEAVGKLTAPTYTFKHAKPVSEEVAALAESGDFQSLADPAPAEEKPAVEEPKPEEKPAPAPAKPKKAKAEKVSEPAEKAPVKAAHSLEDLRAHCTEAKANGVMIQPLIREVLGITDPSRRAKLNDVPQDKFDVLWEMVDKASKE